jgi:hypothetical protein
VFETMVRPAMTAFFRHNYQAEWRGRASGIIRGWCALAFLVANLASASVMQFSGGGKPAISIQMICAALSLAACWLCIRAVRMREAEGRTESVEPGDASFQGGLGILRRDRRFRVYLLGTTLFLVGGLLYVSLIPAVLSKNFGYGYVAGAMLLHVVPSLVSFVSTQWVGRHLDRLHPLKLWSVLRFGWGLDPLLLAATALFLPGGTPGLLLAGAARFSRGAAMGNTWVLWWLVGVNYFAAPGADTSRYMGIQILINGAARLGAAGLSAWLLVGMDRLHILFLGGFLVMLSSLHAWWQARHDPEGAGSLLEQDRRYQGSSRGAGGPSAC